MDEPLVASLAASRSRFRAPGRAVSRGPTSGRRRPSRTYSYTAQGPTGDARRRLRQIPSRDALRARVARRRSSRPDHGATAVNPHPGRVFDSPPQRRRRPGTTCVRTPTGRVSAARQEGAAVWTASPCSSYRTPRTRRCVRRPRTSRRCRWCRAGPLVQRGSGTRARRKRAINASATPTKRKSPDLDSEAEDSRATGMCPTWRPASPNRLQAEPVDQAEGERGAAARRRGRDAGDASLHAQDLRRHEDDAQGDHGLDRLLRHVYVAEGYGRQRDRVGRS